MEFRCCIVPVVLSKALELHSFFTFRTALRPIVWCRLLSLPAGHLIASSCTLAVLGISTIPASYHDCISCRSAFRRVEFAELSHKLLAVNRLDVLSTARSGFRLSAQCRVVDLLAFLDHLDHGFTRLALTYPSHHPQELVLSLGLLAVEKFLHFLDVLGCNRDTHTTSTGLRSNIWLSTE